MRKRNVVILGAGLAGLYFACKNINPKVNIILIEKEKEVGGLARTIEYKNFRFDIGGHRFFTNYPNVLKEFKEIIGKDLIKVKKKSKIYFNDRFIDYPLKINALFGLKPLDLIRILIDNLFKRKKKSNNFEEDIDNRFGKTLFDLYFKDYTEKVVGIKCQKLSCDWSKSRIQNLNLLTLIKGLIIRNKKLKTYIDSFYYCKEGIGILCNNLLKKLKKEKGIIMLNSNLEKISYKNNKIDSIMVNNKKIAVDELISTIPINELIGLFKLSEPYHSLSAGLKYRSVIVIFIVVNKEKITDNHWIYFPDKEIIFGRLHEPKNWSEGMCSNEKSSMCLEIFCDEGDDMWCRNDDLIIKRCIKDLGKIKLVKKKEIVDSVLVRVRNAYPIYEIGYKDKLKKIKKEFSKFDNLKIIGRTGNFDYINMDEIMYRILKFS